MSKYEVGQKFTIELAEKFKGSDGHTLYRVEPFASMVLDKNGLDKLTPANDSYNAYQDGYEEGYVVGYSKGKDEAYKNPVPTQDAYNKGLRDMYMAMIWSARNTNADTPKLWAIDVNNFSPRNIFEAYKNDIVNKAKKGLKEYLQENLIIVGTEVLIDYPGDNKTGIVIKIHEEDKHEYIDVLFEDGNVETFNTSLTSLIHKTGRVFKMVDITEDKMVDITEELEEGDTDD